jgi:anti-anti-sigma regulatory factor
VLAKPTTPQPALSGTGMPAADAPAGRLVIESSRQGPFTVMKMAGPLQAATVITAEAELLSTIVLAPAPLRLALDLTEVTALDSRGVGLLAKTRFAVRATRGTLHLIAPADSPAYNALHLGVTGSVMHWARDVAELLTHHDDRPHHPAQAEDPAALRSA